MIIGLIGILIVMSIIFMFRKTDEKVDEYKIKRDPNDFTALSKVAFNNVKKGNFQVALEQFEKIHASKPSDIRVNLILGPFYYKLKNYDKAEPIIEYTIKNILVDKEPQKLRFEEDLEFLIAENFYFYGHMAYRKGDLEQALFYKKQSRIYDKEVEKSKSLY